MNEQIAQLQDSDPEFARTLKRLRAASYGLAAAIILAAGLGLWAVVVNSEQATQITKIQKTPCTLHAQGEACTRIKERIARHGSLKNPCIEHQRVEGTKGRNCKRFYIPVGGRSQETAAVAPGGNRSPAPATQGDSGLEPIGTLGPVEGTKEGTSGGTKQPPNSQEPQHQAEPEQPSADTEAVTTPPESTAAALTPPSSSNPPTTSEAQKPLVPLVPAVEAVCTFADRLAHLC